MSKVPNCLIVTVKSVGAARVFSYFSDTGWWSCNSKLSLVSSIHQTCRKRATQTIVSHITVTDDTDTDKDVLDF